MILVGSKRHKHKLILRLCNSSRRCRSLAHGASITPCRYKHMNSACWCHLNELSHGHKHSQDTHMESALGMCCLCCALCQCVQQTARQTDDQETFIYIACHF
jgi:hypothetical protein